MRRSCAGAYVPGSLKPVRGMLIVNPRATTTSPRVTDVLIRAFAGSIDLQTVVTERAGHARELGSQARADGLDVVVTLGGDGTIHETVNGMLTGDAATPVPVLATVPGGSANVFARALGLPADAVEATGAILEALRSGRTRAIGLGTLTIAGELPRWFLANAGLGLDAEIIDAMEADRAQGGTATPGRYVRLTLREFFRRTDRRSPALRIMREGQPDIEGVFLAIVQNTSPWTFLGSRPLSACPEASFDTGLDVLGLRDLSVVSSLNAARRMALGTGADTKRLTLLHDQSAFEIRSRRPIAVQADGEGLGLAHAVAFRSHPAAIRAAV